MSTDNCCFKTYRLFSQPDVIIYTVATVVPSIGIGLSYSFEKASYCNPDCKVWLSGEAIRFVLALITVIFIQGVAVNLISFDGDIGCFHKILELLDVFGTVWFVVGNLLLFANGNDCHVNQPICFSFVAIVILLLYILYGGPFLFHVFVRLCCGIGMEHPTGLDRNQRNRIQQYPHLNNGPLLTNINQTNNAQELTNEQFLYWTTWLRNHHGFDNIDVDKFKNETTEIYADNNNKNNVIKCSKSSQSLHNKDDVEEGLPTSPSSSSSLHTKKSSIIGNETLPDSLNNNNNVFGIPPNKVMDTESQTSIPIHSLEGIKSNQILDDINQYLCPICLDPVHVPKKQSNSPTDHNRHEHITTKLANTITNNICHTQTNITNTTLPTNHTTTTATTSPEEGLEISDPMTCVAYPCHARHVFHLHCLCHWLQSSSTRRSYSTAVTGSSATSQVTSTCPCCRENQVS